MPVLLTKTDDNHIGIRDCLSGADGVQPCTLVVMPEFVIFCPHDRNTTIVAGRVISDRAGKHHIKTCRTGNDLITPVSVNFTRKIDPHRHVHLPKDLLDPNTWEPGDAITMRPSIVNGWKPNRAGL